MSSLQHRQQQAPEHDHSAEHGHGPAFTEPEVAHTAATGAGVQGRQDGSRIPAAYKAQLLAKLQASPTMRQILEEVGGDFDVLWSSRGTHHVNGTIYLDSAKNEHYGSFLHELEHLRAYRNGEQPHPKKLDRDTFVGRAMDNEVKAHSQAYVGLVESGAESDGTGGYNQFRKWLRRNHRDLLKEPKNEIDAAVRASLLAEVAAAYVREQLTSNDKWKTSVADHSHLEHYGQIWDRYN